jgi:hypothetical protein
LVVDETLFTAAELVVLEFDLQDLVDLVVRIKSFSYSS